MVYTFYSAFTALVLGKRLILPHKKITNLALTIEILNKIPEIE